MASLLETGQIRLRALEPDDVESLYLWENDTDVWRVSETLAPFSRAALREFIASQQYDIYQSRQLRLVIEHKPEGEAVGTVDLFDFDPHSMRAAVGILVYGDAARGKGFGRQALQLVMNYARQTLGLHQLYCDVYSDNAPSLALFEGAGFRTVGVKCAWNRCCGQWRDVVMMQYLF